MLIYLSDKYDWRTCTSIRILTRPCSATFYFLKRQILLITSCARCTNKLGWKGNNIQRRENIGHKSATKISPKPKQQSQKPHQKEPAGKRQQEEAVPLPDSSHRICTDAAAARKNRGQQHTRRKGYQPSPHQTIPRTPTPLVEHASRDIKSP